jgi:hypothetical protein
MSENINPEWSVSTRSRENIRLIPSPFVEMR